MAITIKEFKSCDLCAAADEESMATEDRVFPHPVTGVDLSTELCALCAVILDLVMPRLAYVQARLAAIERFLTIARKPPTALTPSRVHKALEGTVSAAEDPRDDQLSFADAPMHLYDSPYVFCLECRPPARVAIFNRSAHARVAHVSHEYEVLWGAGTAELPFACDAVGHDACAEVEFALPTAEELTAHEKAPAPASQAPPPTPALVPAQTSKSSKKRPTRVISNGRWIERKDQVGCPLPHPRPGAPVPYWVAYGHQTDHAKKAHDLEVAAVDWFTKDGDPFTLEFPCTEHPECVSPSGKRRAFPSAHALERHVRVVKGARKKKLADA